MSGGKSSKKSNSTPEFKTYENIVQAPGSYNTGFGTAQWGGNGYNLSANNDVQNNKNVSDSSQAFGAQLQNVMNPNAAIDKATSTYRNAMEPAFNRQRDASMGQAKAGLGNQYFSTFGQLTMNDAANQAALARAQLEKSIYDSGQNQYNTEINRANSLGSIAGQAQTNQMAPYSTLMDLMNSGNNAIGNMNNSRLGLNSAAVSAQNSANQLAANNGGSGTQQMIGQLGGAAMQMLPMLLA